MLGRGSSELANHVQMQLAVMLHVKYVKTENEVACRNAPVKGSLQQVSLARKWLRGTQRERRRFSDNFRPNLTYLTSGYELRQGRRGDGGSENPSVVVLAAGVGGGRSIITFVASGPTKP